MIEEAAIHKERQPLNAKYQAMKKEFSRDVKNLPPLKAFLPDTLPRVENGRIFFERPLTLERRWSEDFWMKMTNRLTKKERQNFQIVVISPPKSKTGNGDFLNTEKFIHDLNKFEQKLEAKNNVSTHPIAKLKRIKHSDDIEYTREIRGVASEKDKLKSVYIVSSIVSEDDLEDINAVADYYHQIGVKEINLIAPFLRDEREDKNVIYNDEGKPLFDIPTVKVLKIRNLMNNLSKHHINRIITFEPHSGATQAFAAIYGIALAPMSLEEEFIGPKKEEIIKERDQWIVASPDFGRNLVARRIANGLGIGEVHLDQKRDSNTGKKVVQPLTPEQKKLVKDKNIILYDDEGGTFSTIRNVFEQFINVGVKSFHIFLGHARLQGGWVENLNYILTQAHKKGISIKIYVSDSRRPLGNLKYFIDHNPHIIEKVSIAKKVIKVIKTSIRGVNYWVNKGQEGVDWERAILQRIPWYDN